MTEARGIALAKLDELLHLVDRAQVAVDDAWERVVMTTDPHGEADQMAILDYEMALNDLFEASFNAGLIKESEQLERCGVLGWDPDAW